MGGTAHSRARLAALPRRIRHSAAVSPRNLRSNKAFTLWRRTHRPLHSSVLRRSRRPGPFLERHPIVGTRRHELWGRAGRWWAPIVHPTFFRGDDAQLPRGAVAHAG